MLKRRVALYVRVSTQEQVNEGHSIGEQTERLTKYCEAMDWIVAGVYTDPGYTGSNTNRPALTRLIEAVKASLVDMVLVYKLDRLSRSQKDTLYIIEDVFLKNNVEFVSMCENFDTSSPFGRAMIGILSVFAQLEREQIKERMAMGHVGRAKEGYWHGGSGAPIGYDFIDGCLEINEYEALQVREIYDLFLKGNSIHGITDIMKSKYTNRYSGWNNHGTVGTILKNRIYIGKLKYKGKEYEGQHKPIVLDDIFNAAQLRYKEYQKSFGKSQKTPYKGKHLLSGMMFCGNCGARYFTHCVTRKDYGTYYYYKCYSRDGNKEMKKIDGCKNPTYREDVLDKMIIDEINKLAFNPSEIERLATVSLSKTNDNAPVLQKRISEVDKQINKLMDLYQVGMLPIADISNRIVPLQEEKKKLEEELASYSLQDPLLSTEEAKQIVSTADDVMTNGDAETKRLFVNSLISKIVIFPETVEIHWKFTC